MTSEDVRALAEASIFLWGVCWAFRVIAQQLMRSL